MIWPTLCIYSKRFYKPLTKGLEKKVIFKFLFLVCVYSMFHSTHRNTKLGHRDVIWVNTETHTLLDVWRKAPGLWWTFTFLLSGAPEKKKKTQKGRYSWMINRHTRMCAHIHTHVVTWSGFTSFHLLAPGRRRMSHHSLTELHLSYFVSGTKLATVGSEWKPSLQGEGQLHLKQWFLYVWKWSWSAGKEVGLVFVKLS